MDVATISVIIAGAVTIIGAIVAGTVTIITTLKSTSKEVTLTKNMMEVSAAAGVAKGKVRDRKIQEIHLLVNSRLLTVLRLLVAVTKKAADKTGEKDDIIQYEAALIELQKAEASAKTVSYVNQQDSADEDEQAMEAERKLEVIIGVGSKQCL